MSMSQRTFQLVTSFLPTSSLPTHSSLLSPYLQRRQWRAVRRTHALGLGRAATQSDSSTAQLCNQQQIAQRVYTCWHWKWQGGFVLPTIRGSACKGFCNHLRLLSEDHMLLQNHPCYPQHWEQLAPGPATPLRAAQADEHLPADSRQSKEPGQTDQANYPARN